MERVEKTLKHSLKRKISYSLATLVAFMISGTVGFGADIEIVDITAKDYIFNLKNGEKSFLTKLESLKKEIQSQIWQNDQKLAHINDDLFDLVDKGNYYSKPIWDSSQIFFPIRHRHRGTVDDNTREQFKSTIDAVVKYNKKFVATHKKEFENYSKNPIKYAGYNIANYPTTESGVINTLKTQGGMMTQTLTYVAPPFEIEVGMDSVNLAINPLDVKFDISGIQEPGSSNHEDLSVNNLTVNILPPIGDENVKIENPTSLPPTAPNALKTDKIIPLETVAKVQSPQSMNIDALTITITPPNTDHEITINLDAISGITTHPVPMHAKTIKTTKPNANPFSDFYTFVFLDKQDKFKNNSKSTGNDSEQNAFINNYNVYGGTFWSGTVKPTEENLKKAGNGQLPPLEIASNPDVVESNNPLWNTTINSTEPTNAPAGYFDLKTEKNSQGELDEYFYRQSGIIALAQPQPNDKGLKFFKETAKKGYKIENATFYLRGSDNEKYNEDWEKKYENRNTPPAQGTLAIDIFGLYGIKVHLKDSTFNLYDKSNAIWAYTYGGLGYSEENTLFNVKGSDVAIYNLHGVDIIDGGGRAEIFGEENENGTVKNKVPVLFKSASTIKLDTPNNSLYLIKRFGRDLKIDNSGKVDMVGAKNIGFSVLTYVANKSKYVNSLTGTNDGAYTTDDFIPHINITNPLNLTGDENVGLFFSHSNFIPITSDNGKMRFYNKNTPYDVGIHQGFFDIKMNIGKELGGATQSDESNLAKLTRNDSDLIYTKDKVDGAIGIFASSGQRFGVGSVMGDPDYYKVKSADGNVVTPISDTTINSINKDTIHNLIFDKFDIKFGKYSKNGIMFVAKNGTVIDIVPQSGVRVSDSANGGLKDFIPQTQFSDGEDINNDGVIDEKDTKNASQSTVIAYANGVWTKDNTKLNGSTALPNTPGLENSSTEIRINQSLDMVSKSGIAFMGEDGGKVTFGFNGIKDTNSLYTSTEPTDLYVNAYSGDSIIAYAKGKYKNGTDEVPSKVEVNGKIKAQGQGGLVPILDVNGNPTYENGKLKQEYDENAYTNVASYATDGGRIVISGDMDLYGTAGFAEKDSNIEINGTDNTIDKGAKPALLAKDNSKITFGGGTITNTAETFMYADDNSHIEFTGETTIKMVDGTVFTANPEDYGKDNADPNKKYIGMKNVTLEIAGPNINLGVIHASLGTTITDGKLSFAKISNPNGVGGITYGTDKNGKSYEPKAAFFTGTITISNANPINMDNHTVFKDIKMQQLNVTIVNELTGKKGFQIASSPKATANTESGYTLNNTAKLTITNNNETQALYVNYGHIDNNGTVVINKGQALVGVNGSKINNGGKIEVQNGQIGIYSKAVDDLKTKFIYGTDKKIKDKTLVQTDKLSEVVNSGKITATTDSSFGIYVENNFSKEDNKTLTKQIADIKALSTIDNKGTITVGNKGVGVYTTQSTIKHSGEIIVGENGIGIISKKGSINLTDGKFTLGNNGVGILIDDTNTTTGKLILQNNGTVNSTDFSTYKGIGLYVNADKDISLTNDIDGTKLKNGVLIYGDKNHKVTNSGALSLNDNGFGIYKKKGEIDNSGKITLSSNTSEEAKSVGIYAENGSVSNSGAITLNGQNQIGIHSKYDTKPTTDVVSLTNTITMNGDKEVGLKLVNSKTSVGDKIVFNNDKTHQKGINAENSNITITENLNMNADNNKEHIFAQLSKGSMIDFGTNILTVDGQTKHNDNKKSIGVFLEDENNSFTGKMSVNNGAIGVVAKGNNTIDMKNSAINDAIGIYAENGSTIKGDATISKAGIGVYGGNLQFDNNNNNGNTFTLNDKNSVAVYLTNKGSGVINVKNNGTNNKNIGVYINGASDNDLKINLAGTNSVGMFVADGITSSNSNDIVSTQDNNVGIYVGKGANFTAKDTTKNIELSGDNSIGVLAKGENGKIANLTNNQIITATTVGINGEYANITNKGVITSKLGISGINSTITNTTAIKGGDNGIYAKDSTLNNSGVITSTQIGIFGKNTDITNSADITSTDETAIFTKVGTLNNSAVVNGRNIGIYGEKTNITNSGTVNANNFAISLNGGSFVNSGEINKDKKSKIGVDLDGATFDGTGGTVYTKGNIAIKLNGTQEKDIKSLGNIVVENDGTKKGIAILGEKSTINSPVDIAGDGVVGVVARESVIKGNITMSGKGSYGVYLEDEDASIDNATIITGENIDKENKSIGVFVKKSGTYEIKNTTIDAKNGTGLYVLSADAKDKNGNKVGAKTINFSGTVSTSGVGIYLADGNEFTDNGITLNISGGTGIGIKNSDVSLAQSKELKINFQAPKSIAISQEGGKLTLGDKVAITGKGTLLNIKNGSAEIGANFSADGQAGLIGVYDNITTDQNLINNGTITITNGGQGITAMKNGSTAITNEINIINKGTLDVSGKNGTSNSLGMYSDIANIKNDNIINVSQDGVGIYANDTDKDLSSKTINLIAGNSFGIKTIGKLNSFNSTQIISAGNYEKQVGVILESTAGNVNDINLGTITLGDKSSGVQISDNKKALSLNGTLTVGNEDSTGLSVKNSTNLITNNATINIGTKSTSVYLENAKLKTDFSKINVKDAQNENESSTYINMKNGSTLDASNGLNVGKYHIGIVMTGTANTLVNPITINTKGGTGIYIKDNDFTGNATINVLDGELTKYSVGAYYKNVNVNTKPTINQTGSYSVGIMLDNATTTQTFDDIVLNAHHQVGIKSTGGTLKLQNIIIGDGNYNYGIYAENGDVSQTGNIVLDDNPQSDDKSKSYGMILKNSSLTNTAGKLNVGENNIGIYAQDMNNKNIKFTSNGDISVKNGSAIYAIGSGDITLTTSKDITLTGNSRGIYAKGMNVDLSAKNINIDDNGAMGVVSYGSGNIDIKGNVNIGNKKENISIGVYKNGTGNISISKDKWNVGNYGFGAYLDKGSQDVVLTNYADIVLNPSAIAFASQGTNTINNFGTINVGETQKVRVGNEDKYKTSMAMYLNNGSKGSNNGTINVHHKNSLGVFVVKKGSNFVNKKSATINVTNGGIGVYATDGGTATNEGRINVSGNGSRGMVAEEKGKVINNGTMIVSSKATGILVNNGTFENNGTIVIKSGATAIKGASENNGTGKIVNQGGEEFGAIADGNRIFPKTDIGIKFESAGDNGNGIIKVNGYETTIGATFVAEDKDKILVLNDAVVNLVSRETYIKDGITNIPNHMPLFEAGDIKGRIKLTSDFAATGNGLTWRIENFIKATKVAYNIYSIQVETSPLYVAQISNNGALNVAKVSFEELAIGTQFKNLYIGMDNSLKRGKNGTATAIMKMDKYLEEEYNNATPEKKKEIFRKSLSENEAELRGDIYANIQDRMQDIDEGYRDSFNELFDAYNHTKNSNKYSVIYTTGDYRNNTIGVDSYDYKVMGLLYMKEYEGLYYKDKHGYTLGFTGSDFHFKDNGGSKEKVYSLRAGVHKYKLLNDTHKIFLRTKLGIGYNRHLSNRKIVLGTNTYTDKGRYNTYVGMFDNKLSKIIYQDFGKKLDIFAGLNMTYGYIQHFNEHGNVAPLDIESNHYFSVKGRLGAHLNYDIYTANDWIIKTKFDGRFVHEFGTDYNGNRARFKNFTTDYYNLITPKKQKNSVIGTVGLNLEHGNDYGVGVEISLQKDSNIKKSYATYGLRFHWTFGDY